MPRVLQVELSPASQAKLALIAAEAERLGELVTAMLDLARSDAGRLKLELESLDPELVVLDAYERLQALAPDRLHLAPPVEVEMARITADNLNDCSSVLQLSSTTPCVTPLEPCSWLSRLQTTA